MHCVRNSNGWNDTGFAKLRHGYVNGGFRGSTYLRAISHAVALARFTIFKKLITKSRDSMRQAHEAT